MGLNIKNERVCELARQAAERRGMTQTGVIELALQRLVADDEAERAKRRARVDELLAEIDATRPLWSKGIDEEDLYDERGLPA